MIQSLRRKLTLLFLGLFLLIYFLGGAAGLVVFYSGLSTALDEEISDLSSEIIPAIEFQDGKPSLKAWARAAAQEKLAFPAGIQIFSTDKRLVESYGLSGKTLLKGEFSISSERQNIDLRSNYEELKFNRKSAGFLQIQMSTEARDDAVKQYGLAMILILPFLSILVALAGYFFSGLAIKPVEKSIQVLKTFVADAGHEFITPVTVVEASIQTLEEILTEEGFGQDVLTIIKRASATMKELASDLIFLAKIDNPGADLPKEKLSIQEFIHPAVEELTEIARAKKIQLRCLDLPNLCVYGNLHSLKIMVSNLVSNAIKYTESGGQVIISAVQEGSKVCISVVDSGIGIPQENIEQIFDRFYRVDQSRSRSAGGSGLGLAIVKAILDLHRAEIDVQSTLGKGTEFNVRMQRAS